MGWVFWSVPALNMVLAAVAAALFAYRLPWAWLLPISGTLMLVSTGFPPAGLGTSTLFVLAAAAYGLYSWNQHRHAGTRVRPRSVQGQECGIGAGLLLLLFLLNGFAGVAPMAEITPLYLIDALLAAVPAVMYLGFAHGIVQSWWLGTASAVTAVIVSAGQGGHAWITLSGAVAAGLHLFGYRKWRQTMRRPLRSKHRLDSLPLGRRTAPGTGQTV